jgi:hypothetical protein
MLAAYLIWLACALLCIGIGIYTRNMQRPAGFFTGDNPPEVTDTAAYNKAVGRLWIRYGIELALIGLPLLAVHQNQFSLWWIFLMLGTPFISILLAVSYLKIQDTYFIKK